MRLGFCGSPPLAVPVLEALCDAGHDVAVVVTRPDRRRGRGGATTPTAVKAAALDRGIPVAEDVTALLDAAVDLGVVVAYGAMVPTSVLDELTVLNLHLSLLPRWRGAAPVERAILAGDVATGVCVMRLDATLDTGPVYASAVTAVADKELGALRDELVALGTTLLLGLLVGTVADLPAPSDQVGEPTYARKVADDELVLDFARPAGELARVVRLGRARTTFDGRRLGVRRIEVLADEGRPGEPGALEGEVVACGAGRLRLVTVVPEGRTEMPFAAYLRGLRTEVPSHLGAPLDP